MTVSDPPGDNGYQLAPRLDVGKIEDDMVGVENHRAHRGFLSQFSEKLGRIGRWPRPLIYMAIGNYAEFSRLF